MDEETQALIANLAEKHAMAEADVQEIYEEKLEQVQESGKEGVEAQNRAKTLLFNTFKRREQSNSIKVEGYILAAGDRYDAVEYSRDQAIEAYQENPAQAIKDGTVAVACPPEEAGNLTGPGVAEVGQKNGWSIIANPDNEKILQYSFAERDENTGEIMGTDDGDGSVEDGWRIYPLDDRETFGSGDENPRYGLPTDKHNWTRRGLGVFTTEEHDGLWKGQLTFRGKQSASEPPLGEPVQFKARVNEADDQDSLLYINSTSDTQIEQNPDLDASKSIDELIESQFEDGKWLFDLEGVYEFMADKDRPQTVIVKSDVASIDMEPTSNDTLRMVLSEFSFAGGNMVEREATVWIPAWQSRYIDFAADSRVYVIGRASLRDAYDPATGQTTSDKKEVIINAQGLYADPTAKIPREDAEELTEDDVDFGGDDDDFDDSDW